jgi:hypothetical protein
VMTGDVGLLAAFSCKRSNGGAPGQNSRQPSSE